MESFLGFSLLLSLSPPPPPFLLRVVVRSPAPEEQGSKSSREVGIRFSAFENSSRGSTHDVPDTSVLNGRVTGVLRLSLRGVQTITKTADDQNSN